MSCTSVHFAENTQEHRVLQWLMSDLATRVALHLRLFRYAASKVPQISPKFPLVPLLWVLLSSRHLFEGTPRELWLGIHSGDVCWMGVGPEERGGANSVLCGCFPDPVPQAVVHQPGGSAAGLPHPSHALGRWDRLLPWEGKCEKEVFLHNTSMQTNKRCVSAPWIKTKGFSLYQSSLISSLHPPQPHNLSPLRVRWRLCFSD